MNGHLMTEYEGGMLAVADEQVFAWPVKLVGESAVQQCDECDPNRYGWGVYLGCPGDRVHIADVVDKEQARWLVVHVSTECFVRRTLISALKSAREWMNQYNDEWMDEWTRDVLRASDNALSVAGVQP